MDSEQSAFAVYKSNKSSNKIKKTKKRNKARNKLSTSPALPPILHEERKQKEIASKLKKKKNKSKESKNIIKKKQNKKKKEFERLVKNTPVQESEDEIDLISDDEPDLPMLLPAPATKAITEHHHTNGVSSPRSDDSFDFTPVQTDSVQEGLKAFKWMISPYNIDDFFANIWEKKPLHIARDKTDYYKEIITTSIIDNMLRNENIHFTKNIDITSYVDGKRETHNPEGRAHTHIVWDFYLQGCSIRLLNPQTYIPKLHLLNATMQEYFNSFVGANSYLTPPDSQGFAPHYDDIEAFILQTEGKKHWRIYKPLDESTVLPRVSSNNFEQSEIGKPIMEVTLQAGDMLYFPRGYIHQGVTIEGEHSLHVTISMYQKHSWADLFEKLLPTALQMAIEDNVELRRGLPLDIYDHFGIVHSEVETPRKIQIKTLISSLFDKIKEKLPIDDIVDQMHKNYQHDALPPVLSDGEKAVTVFGDSDVMINGEVTNRVEICPDTKIRLLRKNILRMVSEDTLRLYYYVENSLEYHGTEPLFIEIGDDHGPAIERLINTYPAYMTVEELNLPTLDQSLDFADALWSRGLIMTDTPLENIDDD